MSEIKKLIERLCPDGVEYKKLGEVCDFLTGFAFKATTFKKTGLPICKTTNIQNNAIDFDDMDCFDLDDYPCSLDKYIINKNDIVIGMSGSIKVGINKTDRQCYLNQRVGKFSPQDTLHNKFLFYLLCQSISKLSEAISGGSVKNLSNKDVLNFEIPVPPIEVQSKIVEILDNFTELEAELEIKLEAELEARRKQYEYYRNQLLTFDKDKGARFNVKWMKMSDIGTFTRGKRFVRTDIVEDGVPCIHYGDMYTYYGLKADKAKTHLTPEKAQKMRFAKKNDVVIVGAGENKNDIGVGVAWLGEEDVAVHDACYIFSSDLYPQYVSHFLRTESYHKQIYPLVSEGKICSISAQSIGRAIIPIPPLSEQKRIVSILDRFEALTTDLQSGLPAEIEARRKQYEYYREQLLTFKRKTA